MRSQPETMVRIGDDLESVITRGPEGDPGDAGTTRDAVESLWATVQDWYRMGTTPAIQLCLRRNGVVLLNRTIGYGWGNAPGGDGQQTRILATPETPFCGFSTAKGVSATLMFMLIEQGAFAYDDRVSDYLPEFAARGKETITVGDVLTHSAGVPFVTPPYRGFDLVVDEDAAVRGLADLELSWPPRRFRVYHALTSGLIQRLLVQRATGKRLREHLTEQVLDPLGFRWNSFGVAPEDVSKVVPSVQTGPPPSGVWKFLARKALGGGMGGHMDDASLHAFLTAELPSGNLVTTAAELSRFYEILTRGGELDGIRILEPDTVRAAIRPAPRLPGLAGKVSRAGYELGARRSKFGRDTRFHFGRSGLTTQYGWADPERGLAGAVLTSGKATIDTARPAQLVAQISRTLGPIDPADRHFNPCP